MAYQFQNPSQDVIFDYVKRAKTIAIVGLSARKETAAYDVAQAVSYTHLTLPTNREV